MTGRLTAPLVVLVSAALAAVISVLLSLDTGAAGVATGLAAFLVGGAVFAVFPWAIIPVSIIGGSLASGALGADNVRGFVVVHAVPLAAGCAALLGRRLVGLDRNHLRMPRYGIGMIAILLVTVGGGLYGLAVGNDELQVIVAAYHIAIIPAYFFIAIYSLTEPDWRRKAAILFVVSLAILTVAEFTSPVRHGGLMSLLAFPPLVVLAGRHHDWRRAGFAALAAIFAADVALSSYRGLWVGSVVAILIMAVLGRRSVRQGLIATGIAGAVGLALLSAVSAGNALITGRAGLIFEAVDRSAGYRLPEAEVGLTVFADHPLFGAGLGQTTHDVYLAGYKIVDVGPVYHAYYVLLLANIGLIGLIVVLWPVAMATLAGLRQRDDMPLAFAALTCGFLASAMFAGPTDGHWELGLLPALTLLTLSSGPFVGSGRGSRDSSASPAPPLAATR